MNNANHIAEDDLYLFALQSLPDAEMQAVSLHLEECALCRAQMGEIQGDLVAYAMTAETQTPPPRVRERLLAQVAQEKKVIPIDRTEPAVEPVLYPRTSRMFQMEAPEERQPRRLAPVLAWTGWAVAATAMTVAGLQFEQQKRVSSNLAAETAQLDQVTAQTNAQNAQAKELMKTLTDASAMQVSLHVPLTARQQPKLDPEGHATYVPGHGSLLFVASHLDPLQPSKTYELWLLPEQAGMAPIPAGLFRPDANGNASVVMPKLPKGVVAKGFGVTVENEGGSDTPTAPIVLAGL